MSKAKYRKNLNPCRGFKSFRSFVFDCKFGKNGSIHSSFLSTRWNPENGSMKLWKKVGAKKREKSLEISRFLLFSRSDLFWPIMMAGAGGFEPATHGFGDRYSTSWAIPLYQLLYYNTYFPVLQYLFSNFLCWLFLHLALQYNIQFRFRNFSRKNAGRFLCTPRYSALMPT